MPSYTYPSSADLMEIEQEKLPLLTANDPIFSLFPIVTKDAPFVMWEQKDNYTGLQAVRGINGDPGRVKQVGGKRYTMEPGYYGEFIKIDEAQLTLRRQWGSFNQPISIDDLVLESQDQLLDRRISRWKYNLWTLVTTGVFSVSAPNGAVLHTDAYTFQTSNGSDWSTVGSATPLADLREVQLKSRGKSVSFGRDAVAFLNRKYANYLLNNSNSADLGGEQLESSTIFSLEQVNRILIAQDLPQIQIYDEGYLNDSGTFVPFIADGDMVVVGNRMNRQSVGEYQMTRNANNPSLAPGAYTRVIDRGEDTIPRSIEVHDGHNGGIAMHFPSAIVIVDIGA